MTDPLDTSIEGIAASNGEGDPQEALFALDGDKPITGAGLAKRGIAIEAEVSIMSAAVPCRGLIDPEKAGKLMISYEAAKYEYVPVRDRGNDTITSWKLRMHLRPIYVEAVVETTGEEVATPS